ncbi:MAG: hypothetical protein AAF600_19930 [Bacteroidota bacterium]
MAVGQGYNFINKSGKRFFEYGLRYGFEEALKALRNKIAQEAEIKEIIDSI